MIKRLIASALLLLPLFACSASDVDDSESLGETSQALNGSLSPGYLVKHNFSALNEPAKTNIEFYRQTDTERYEFHAGPGPDSDNSGDKGYFFTTYYFVSELRAGFGFDANEVTAVYYNRGDLGLAREMHCVDRMSIDGQVICYVTNFAAGDDGSEFTFGLSRDIAFRNQRAGRSVATVAMVFRKNALANKEQMIFIVYDQNGKFIETAPLDRRGLNFFQAHAALDDQRVNPDPVFGTPGVEFNNHYPTNCQNCHGGTYTISSPGNSVRNVVGSYFLPFDLDQFDYSSEPGLSRSEQEVAFRKLNQMVRKVAVEVGGVESPVVQQIDGWYGNTSHKTTLSGTFNSAYVPPGWSGSSTDIDAYRNVVRPSCRGCHIVSGLNFSDAGSFLALSPLVANDVLANTMPHALQTQRLFWQSSQPLHLENYLRAYGYSDAANTLRKAGPGRVVTLDPPLIYAAAGY